MVDRIGQQLGNYRLVRLLGQGGFADVYLAEHIHLETRVAVKVLSMRLTSENVEHFRAEARTVARLIHPHIVRVLDFGVEDNTPYLAMDYAPNGSLRQRHPKGTLLPLDTIIGYLKQIADALQFAHEKKLIHRDIKPENLLLGENHQVLLSDFGIALIAQSTHYQNTQEIVGTAAYMAPEQLQGKPRRASDQYSLGILIYEWICGDRPFHGSFTEIYSQQLFVTPPPLSEKVPGLPSAVEEVVMTALAKDPKQRFASVRSFATALEQACQPLPSSSTVVLANRSPLSDIKAAPSNLLLEPFVSISPTDSAVQLILPSVSNMPTDPSDQPPKITAAEASIISPNQPIIEAPVAQQNPSPQPSLAPFLLNQPPKTEFARIPRNKTFRNIGMALNALSAILIGILAQPPSGWPMLWGLLYSLVFFSLCIRFVNVKLSIAAGLLVAVYWGYVGIVVFYGIYLYGPYVPKISSFLIAFLPPSLVALFFFIVSAYLHIRYVMNRLP